MRHAILVAVATPAIVFLAHLAQGAGYPEVDALPSRPNMPNPLVMTDGTPVSTKADWFEKRRPEIRSPFEHYMYGKAPAAPEKVTATIDREEKKALGGKATLKQITLAYGPPETPRIQLLLIVPNDRKGPSPAFVGLSFAGVYTVLDDPSIARPISPDPKLREGAKKKAAPDRGAQVGVWNAEAVIDRGYALAVFYCSDIAPDHPGLADGVFPSYSGQDWGMVAAWAWGLSRAVDYLVTDPDIDRNRIAVVGHSRLGKAAMLAGAFDDRIALIIANQAGCGGTAPSRGTVGESVTRINTSFPHWFNARFKTFNDQPEKLPIDQNLLVAMAAPRPVLFTCAVEDTWANPEGQFQVLKAAEPVYRLLGAGGLEADQMPEPGRLIDSRLGYAIRPGKHAMSREDWNFYLDFADKQFGRRPSK